MSDKEDAPNGAICYGEISTAEQLEQILNAQFEIESALSRIPDNEGISILQSAIVDKLSLQKYNTTVKVSKDINISVARIQRYENSKDPDYVAPERFTTEMGVDGMVHLIRDKGTVQGAYNVVAEKHNKDILNLKSIATKEHYNRTQILDQTSLVVPDQISKVVEEGLLNMLDKPTTINSMYVNTYTTMKILGELDALRSKVHELEARQSVTEARVEKIGEHLRLDEANKLAAFRLKAKGYSNKDIAKQLNVVPKTVSRWIKLMKEEIQEGTNVP
jgi:hypothetical protein